MVIRLGAGLVMVGLGAGLVMVAKVQACEPKARPSATAPPPGLTY